MYNCQYNIELELAKCIIFEGQVYLNKGIDKDETICSLNDFQPELQYMILIDNIIYFYDNYEHRMKKIYNQVIFLDNCCVKGIIPTIINSTLFYSFTIFLNNYQY